LPFKFPRCQFVFTDPFGGAGFDIAHQIGETAIRLESEKDMDMVGHTVDDHELLILVADNPGNVPVKVFFPGGPDRRITATNGKDYMGIKLGVGVGHGEAYFVSEEQVQREGLSLFLPFKPIRGERLGQDIPVIA
jgi:hypothetical protein